MSIRIITDSGADIPRNMGASPRADLTILPMHVYFGEKEFQDGVDLTHRQFYEMLIESEELPKTSQIPPYEFEQVYKEAVEAGEQVVVITISGKLSGWLWCSHPSCPAPIRAPAWQPGNIRDRCLWWTV